MKVQLHEEKIRADERNRMTLTLAIVLLPEHQGIFDRIMQSIDRIPLMRTPDPLSVME